MKTLSAFIDGLSGLSAKGWELLQPVLSNHVYKKDAYLLEAGKVCDGLFFISQGYCRAFYDKDGQEINTDFFFENEIATNINSFGQAAPSEFSIQACEDVCVVRFDKKRLYEAAAQSAEIETLGRKCLQRIAAKQEKHAAMFKLMNAQERYAYMATHFPEILQRVSLTQLSSYLGVARETLSRIRGKR
jgi:CRP-like cAMP-binding protein